MRSLFMLRWLWVVGLALGLNACALFAPKDPLNIDVVGIEPLPSQDMEVRFAVKLRIKNPNTQPIDYDGMALQLRVNGLGLASGVSDVRGTLSRFGETVLTVPVSISAFAALGQAYLLAERQGHSQAGLPYVLKGKLSNGLFGGASFTDSGVLNLEQPAP